LQPESVSIPMTCTAQASQRHETDIIEKITGAANAPYMLQCIDGSLDFLQREYFAGTQCEALEALRRHAPRAPHAQQVALFFLLLNIDRELKHKLMCLDQNHSKLTRFYLDLRHELVTGFFCSSQDVRTFTGKCREVYMIA
jgi:hypothetical protein